MGVLSMEPNTPPLVIVKHPPVISSTVILPSRTFRAKSLIADSTPAKSKRIRIAYHRHHQAFGATHRYRDVRAVKADHVVAVNHARYRRVEFERSNNRQRKEAHEAQTDAVLLRKSLLVLLAQIHDRLHIHLVEGGQHGRFVLHGNQTLRQLPTEGAHALACFSTTSYRRTHGHFGVDGILLGDAAVLTRP